MKAILPDIHLQKHVNIMVRILESEDWRELWETVKLPVLKFQDLKLQSDVSDAILWHTCQREKVILLTANRNSNDPDSLEATIRDHNQPDSLPVFTIATAGNVIHSRDYAERAAVRLLDYLLDIDSVRGCGRLFIP